jgi:hypothetical protein
MTSPISKLASIAYTVHVHRLALKLLRSRLTEADVISDMWECGTDAVKVTGNESRIYVYLQGERIYAWEYRYEQAFTNYNPARIMEALEALQRELVLEELADV